jgi:glycosyltransferase involved in cell wall biosynthesis
VVTGPYILLVGLSHKNFSASIEVLRERGFAVQTLKPLAPSSRSLAGSDLAPTAERGMAGPSWLPTRARKILRAAGPGCVAIIAKGARQRGRDAVIAARLRRIPVILKTQHEVFWDPSSAGFGERFRVALRRTLESLIVGSFGVTRISPTRGRGSTRLRGGITYLPHPVTVSLHEPPDLPATPLRVVTVTRCPVSKNNAGLLELADRLRGHEISFTVVFGEDSDCVKCGGTGKDAFVDAAAARGLDNTVVHGPQDDLTDLYRTHHVVIRNSTFEGANVTVIEGASEGCVPIVSTTSGAGYGLFDDGAGYLVDADDVQRQAEILIQLITDVPLRERMRRTAMGVVRERCHPDRFADVIEAAIAGSGPRRT